MPTQDPQGYPIPETEEEFAEDERKAIIEFDGEGTDGYPKETTRAEAG